MKPIEIKQVLRDGQKVWKVKCPKCGIWADADHDQFDGKVSLDCPNTVCDYHETHNFRDLKK